MKTKKLLLSAALTLLLPLTGCMLFDWDSGEEYEWFEVNTSPLDQARIIFYPGRGDPKWKTQQTIDIAGSGLLQLISGTSERARSAFWTEPEADSWNDLYSDRLFLRKEEITLLLQRLVDCGAFPKHAEMSISEDRPNPPYLILYIHIGNRKAIQITTDENLLYITGLLLNEFKADDAAR